MAEFVLLSKHHQRETLDCNNPDLNNYLWHYARQDQKRSAAQTWVLECPENPGRIQAFYTLSAASVCSAQIRFPYSDIPALLLGRLAVDRTAQGKNLGSIAVLDALMRSKKLGQVVGIRFMLTKPINSQVLTFYQKLGFKKLPQESLWYFDLQQI